MEIRLFIVIMGLALSIILNLIFNQVFVKAKRIDKINSRSSHNVIATRTGGISIYIGLFLITLILYFLKKELFDFSLLLPLGILFVTGFYDDLYNADFKLKFFIQIIVAKLLIDQGYIINDFNGFLGLEYVPNLIAQITTVFIFLLIVNSINFIDGIDGLAASIFLFSITSFELLTIKESPLFSIDIICVSLLLPYYLFNLKKSRKVFLGDAGSLFLGGLIAINLFSFLNEKSSYHINFDPTLISIIILFYPLIDLLRVFTIRVRNGTSPFQADKNHLHHRLESIFYKHYFRSLFITSLNFLLLVIILIIENSSYTFFSIIILLILSFGIIKIK